MAIVNSQHKQAAKMAVAALRNKHGLGAIDIGLHLEAAILEMGYQVGNFGDASDIAGYAFNIQAGKYNEYWDQMPAQVRGYAGALVARVLEASALGIPQ